MIINNLVGIWFSNNETIQLQNTIYKCGVLNFGNSKDILCVVHEADFVKLQDEDRVQVSGYFKNFNFQEGHVCTALLSFLTEKVDSSIEISGLLDFKISGFLGIANSYLYVNSSTGDVGLKFAVHYTDKYSQKNIIMGKAFEQVARDLFSLRHFTPIKLVGRINLVRENIIIVAQEILSVGQDKFEGIAEINTKYIKG